jgi:hypothetical protein
VSPTSGQGDQEPGGGHVSEFLADGLELNLASIGGQSRHRTA